MSILPKDITNLISLTFNLERKNIMNLEEYKQVEMLTAEDVATILNIPKSRAYTIIREMNAELKKRGKLILRGRINRTYFMEKIIP